METPTNKKVNAHEINLINTQLNVEMSDIYCYQVSAENGFYTELNFQHGPVSENGVNGITNEVLLAVVLHRLQNFKSHTKCPENEHAIVKVQEALQWLLHRIRSRNGIGNS